VTNEHEKILQLQTENKQLRAHVQNLSLENQHVRRIVGVLTKPSSRKLQHMATTLNMQKRA
jgi:hypothetical protein